MWAVTISITNNAQIVVAAEPGPMEPWTWFLDVEQTFGVHIVKPCSSAYYSGSMALYDAWEKCVEGVDTWTKVTGPGGAAEWRQRLINKYGLHFQHVAQALGSGQLDFEGVEVVEID